MVRAGLRALLPLCLAALCAATACSQQVPAATPSVHTAAGMDAEEPPGDDLSPEARRALSTLQQLDSHPLYTMCLCGEAAVGLRQSEGLPADAVARAADPSGETSASNWGCSLFAALGAPQAQQYGRNFDWEYSPALLLFTDPPDGYASVTMVDIAYLGFDGEAAAGMLDLPLAQRQALLSAPHLPFDGMNEAGLVVGMAAVPDGQMQADPDKETVGSLMLMRLILNQAGNVQEALAIVKRYNIDHGGGPPIHYLIADATGQAALVEFHDGRMVVLPNDRPWHLATNFLRAAADGSAKGHCWRYDRLSERLQSADGRLSAGEAMALLRDVAQPNTQWSVVYDLSARQVHVAMHRAYDTVYTLPFELCGPACGQ